jgi:hypothetical protein
MELIFDHEKLDVYGLELKFVAWTIDFLEEVLQSSVPHRRELLDQLDRACISVLLNTAEGNGKRQGLQRASGRNFEHEDEHEEQRVSQQPLVS